MMAWRESWNQPTDREEGYVRARGPRLGQLPGVKWLLIINIAVFILDGLTRGGLSRFGAFSVTESLLHFRLYQVVTYQFLHAGLGHIFWNMFGLWMFGRFVEAQFGTRRFVWMYLICGVAGAMAEGVFNWMLVAAQVPPPAVYGTWLSVPMVGASAGVSGVIVAFAVLNPNALLYLFFLLPVKAKWVAVGWAVLTTIWALEGLRGAGTNVAHAAHLGGMAFAFVWTYLAYRRRGGLPQGVGKIGRWLERTFGLKPSGGQASGRPGGSGGPWSHPVVGGPNSERDLRDEERLDGILRKVHEQGLDALSESERKFLREMSERKRDQTRFDDHYRRE